jgi:membrane-bound inhibitor of C-type lysozyme
MTRNRPLAVALMGGFALAGCNRDAAEPAVPVDQTPPSATATAPAAPPIGYACESGETVMVQYPDTGTAQVAYKGQTYTLRIAPSGSGARYAGSGVEWWTASRNGLENATLSRLGPNEQVGTVVLERCSRPSSNPDLPTPGPGPTSDAGVTGVACRAADLRLSNDGGDAGAGNRANVFGVTNAGAAACSLSGYPVVSLLDAQGRALTAVRSDQNPAVATPVTVQPNAKAYFDIAWNVVPNEANGERACPAVARVSLRVGNDPASLALPLAFTPCGGRIRVNPFRATSEPSLTPPPAAA